MPCEGVFLSSVRAGEIASKCSAGNCALTTAPITTTNSVPSRLNYAAVLNAAAANEAPVLTLPVPGACGSKPLLAHCLENMISFDKTSVPCSSHIPFIIPLFCHSHLKFTRCFCPGQEFVHVNCKSCCDEKPRVRDHAARDGGRALYATHTWTGPKFQIPKAGQLGRLADYAITRWREASAGPAHHCCSLCIAACRWMFMR